MTPNSLRPRFDYAVWRALLAAAVLVWSAGPAAADYLDGLAAYERGENSAAMQEWTVAAAAGDLDAIYALGILYLYGRGEARDALEAAAMFRRAAEGRHAGAQYALGVMYHDGNGVPRDFREAARYYALAAD